MGGGGANAVMSGFDILTLVTHANRGRATCQQHSFPAGAAVGPNKAGQTGATKRIVRFLQSQRKRIVHMIGLSRFALVVQNDQVYHIGRGLSLVPSAVSYPTFFFLAELAHSAIKRSMPSTE